MATATTDDYSAKDKSVDLGSGMEMEFVCIPAGSFLMGSEKGHANEKPVHPVTLTKPYYLGKYEVTQEQWQAVMSKDHSLFKAARNPVDYASWDDCQQFLVRLNKKLSGWKASLPTEAQWEYACRAGSSTRFYYGDDEARLAEYAWYADNADGTTHPVGQKKPNAWGLYDMVGNVWEWCSDWYGSYRAGAQENPQGPRSGLSRVLRGGAFDIVGAGLSSSRRSGLMPGGHCNCYGLRIVLLVVETARQLGLQK